MPWCPTLPALRGKCCDGREVECSAWIRFARWSPSKAMKPQSVPSSAPSNQTPGTSGLVSPYTSDRHWGMLSPACHQAALMYQPTGAYVPPW